MKKDNTPKTSLQEEKKAPQELDLDDLNQVQGGSIGSVSYTSTSDVSRDTQSKI